MTKQTIIGDKLWDEILKAIVYVMPEQLFPLIREVYGKEYPPDTPIKFLNPEHSAYLNDPNGPLSSTLMDISFLVAEADYYHVECQMKNDKLMVIRMISYDLHYAIEHCMTEDGSADEMIIRFPHSMVLYPDQNKDLPEKLQCRVIFQDGSEHLYRIPAVRIQTYSLEEIRKKHLDLFIPYLLLRLKPRLDSKSKPLTKRELTAFVNKVILLLQEETDTGYLTRQECNDYIHFFLQASRHIFYHYPDHYKEVQRMTKPLIYIPSLRMKELEESIAEKEAVLAEKETALAEKETALAESRNALTEKDSALAEKDSEIALLRARIAALESQS